MERLRSHVPPEATNTIVNIVNNAAEEKQEKEEIANKRRKNNNDDYGGNGLLLPIGFRFVPTEKELIKLLSDKVIKGTADCYRLIVDEEVYAIHPKNLAGKHESRKSSGNWYFFSSRDRKYPKGKRPNRSVANGDGFWKATGKEKDISDCDGKVVGWKRGLNFHEGKQKAGKNQKTGWKMVEFTVDESHIDLAGGSMKLDEWVLCKIYFKMNNRKKKDRDNSQDNSYEQEEDHDEENSSNQVEQQRLVVVDSSAVRGNQQASTDIVSVPQSIRSLPLPPSAAYNPPMIHDGYYQRDHLLHSASAMRSWVHDHHQLASQNDRNSYLLESASSLQPLSANPQLALDHQRQDTLNSQQNSLLQSVQSASAPFCTIGDSMLFPDGGLLGIELNYYDQDMLLAPLPPLVMDVNYNQPLPDQSGLPPLPDQVNFDCMMHKNLNYFGNLSDGNDYQQQLQLNYDADFYSDPLMPAVNRNFEKSAARVVGRKGMVP